MDSKILKIIKEIKQKYLTLGLTEKEITSIIKLYLQNIQSTNKTIEEVISNMPNELTASLNEYIKKQIEDSNYDTILHYITITLTIKDNKKACIVELNKIKDFCSAIGIIPDIDLYNELINSSSTIKELIGIIIAEHIEDIEQNKIK